MTSTTQTPPAWDYDTYDDHFSFYAESCKTDYLFRLDFSDEIAEPEVRRSLNLIAAAPQMLEALEWQEMADADPAAARPKGYYDRAAELRRAAIAKAKAGAA